MTYFYHYQALLLVHYAQISDADRFSFVALSKQHFVDTQLFSVHTDLVLSFFQKE